MTRSLLALPAVLLVVMWRPSPPPTVSRMAPPGRAAGLLVVAQDGSGDYRSIQAAIDAIPPDNASLKIVLVRNGTYQEKVYLDAGHVALVGEDREKTRIVYPQLRREWRATHPSDWGAAVLNLGERASDLVIGNLTVYNNYGSLHGDHDHQFAIRSWGASTRIALLSANVLADGGDTLSLWNAAGGMYYHADCTFEGWVDFVCPRGWCYITNSRFFSHNTSTAGIWHDGSQDQDAKFVIRRSQFDGVPGFPLGRNNRDGQFYLLDNLFSARMADRPIYPALAPETYRWGKRYYYSGNHREGGDFAWFADNLSSAPASPREHEVTPRWTFAGRWDPEETLPAVLPFASVPRPETRSAGIAPGGATLRWIAGRLARSHRVYLGTSRPPRSRGERSGTTFDTGALEPNRTYYWRVDTVSRAGVVPGPTWEFRTAPAAASPRRQPRSGGDVPRAVRETAASDGATGDARPRLRVVLVGDSTVTDEVGWGLGFKARLEPGVECVNRAKNGRSSKSYRAEGLWAAALKERPDYVLIQFGHNDQPGKGPERETDPKTTYRENLERYADEARAAGAEPVIVTSLTRRNFGPDGRIVSDLGPYVEAARDVASNKNIPLVDLNAASISLLDRLGPTASAAFDPPRPDGTPDRTHLTRRGSEVFGSLVADGLRRSVLRLSDAIRP